MKITVRQERKMNKDVSTRQLLRKNGSNYEPKHPPSMSDEKDSGPAREKQTKKTDLQE